MNSFSILAESTTDYEKFITLNGNRSIIPAHVKKLAANISACNLLQYQPILVNEAMEVIDGQHRLAAARILKVPIYYTVIPEGDLSVVRNINANLKSWTLRDFAESFAAKGNAEYQTLLNFTDEFSIPITTCVGLLSGKNALGGSERGELIRSGRFVARNEANARAFVEVLKRFEPYTDNDVFLSREFITAILHLIKMDVDMDRLIKKLASIGEKIRKQVDYKRYLLILQDAYNRHASKNKIDLFETKAE